MEKNQKPPNMTKCGNYQISTSSVKRLEKELKAYKDEYDSLKIKQLTKHGQESDPGRLKQEETLLNTLKKQIKNCENTIIEIRLEL